MFAIELVSRFYINEVAWGRMGSSTASIATNVTSVEGKAEPERGAVQLNTRSRSQDVVTGPRILNLAKPDELLPILSCLREANAILLGP